MFENRVFKTGAAVVALSASTAFASTVPPEKAVESSLTELVIPSRSTLYAIEKAREARAVEAQPHRKNESPPDLSCQSELARSVRNGIFMPPLVLVAAVGVLNLIGWALEKSGARKQPSAGYWD